MDRTAVNAISETITAIAVIGSLIYVGVQIQQNTKMMRSTAKQGLTEAAQNLIYNIIENADEWTGMTASEKPASAAADLRMSMLVRAMCRGFETQCYQYEAGLLKEDEWHALRNAIQDICALPGVRRHWEQLKPHVSERLHKVVEAGREHTA